MVIDLITPPAQNVLVPDSLDPPQQPPPQPPAAAADDGVRRRHHHRQDALRAQPLVRGHEAQDPEPVLPSILDAFGLPDLREEETLNPLSLLSGRCLRRVLPQVHRLFLDPAEIHILLAVCFHLAVKYDTTDGQHLSVRQLIGIFGLRCEPKDILDLEMRVFLPDRRPPADLRAARPERIPQGSPPPGVPLLQPLLDEDPRAGAARYPEHIPLYDLCRPAAMQGLGAELQDDDEARLDGGDVHAATCTAACTP